MATIPPIELEDALLPGGGLAMEADQLRVDQELLDAVGVVSPHAVSHQDGGPDAISVAGLQGVLAQAQAADKLVVTGPATLALGAVADGQVLKRVGATVVGVAAPAAGSVTYRTTASFAVGGSAAAMTGIPAIAMAAGQYYRVVCAGMVMATGANAAFHMFPSPVTGAQNSYASATENSRTGYMSATETNPAGGASATAENSMSQHTMSTSGGDADYLSAKLPTASKRYLVRIEMNFKLQTADTVELRVSSAGAIPMTVDKGFAVTVTPG